MLVTEGNGIPIGLLIESATPHEVKLAEATLATVRVAQRRGRPRTRPRELVADKAYDSRKFRSWLRRRGIKATIPHFERRQRKKPKRGRPFAPVGAGYRSRWKIERAFAHLQNFRRLLVRYERHVQVFRGFCLIACLLIALRHF
jgi:transposase